jgi:contractile injection system tube protein
MSDGEAVKVEPAKFYTKANGGSQVEVPVTFFNPVSLQYSVANTLSQQGNGKQQYVSQSTAKLTMDLVFDTTDTGTDVRSLTSQMAALMDPGTGTGNQQSTVPKIVVFEWGAFSFQGMVESYKETIDFFAPEGVPLRASVNLTLSRQDKVFEADPMSGSKAHAQPQDVSLGGGLDLTRLISSIGSPGQTSAADMTRRIGSANGLESLRNVAARAVTVATSLLSGANGSNGSNGSNGVGNGASAGGAVPSVRVGGSLSAGVTAAAGAFAGLRSPTVAAPASIRMDLDRLLPQEAQHGISTGADAQFRLGGRAEMQGGGGGGLSANVGAAASLSSELLFEE